LSFRVAPSEVSEKSRLRQPIPLVKDLALRKAMSVARRLHPLTRPSVGLSPGRGDRKISPLLRGEGRVRGPLVLGADTVVVLRGKILGKPGSHEAAVQMLGHLAGTTHAVYTGVALVDAHTGRSVVSYAKSVVRMKKMPPPELRRFSRKHLDKAGAYAIQERRDPIARVVKGSYDNVVGLPVGLVRRLLKRI
jgi:septum formation protein